MNLGDGFSFPLAHGSIGCDKSTTITKMLADAGADVNKCDSWGEYVIHRAIVFHEKFEFCH